MVNRANKALHWTGIPLRSKAAGELGVMLLESIPMKFTYMKTPLNRYTFKNDRIRLWVEKNSQEPLLNLFAGETPLALREIRNDIREEMPADFHMDALEFVKQWHGEPFGTVLLDPPYSFRKSMEMYEGKVMSPFNALKNAITRILQQEGSVITFGYHSVSMGKKRGFEQEHLLIMSHGGAIHDTLAIVERQQRSLFSAGTAAS